MRFGFEAQYSPSLCTQSIVICVGMCVLLSSSSVLTGMFDEGMSSLPLNSHLIRSTHTHFLLLGKVNEGRNAETEQNSTEPRIELDAIGRTNILDP